MKKICFITGTRADYGILAPIMQMIKDSGKATLQIIATNMHLSPEYGMTVNDIEDDGFTVDEKISSLAEGGDMEATVMSMAKVQEGLSKAFQRLEPDMVVILGDRYEALAAASAAVVFNIPIAHLHGGETTEGAIDDKFRHAITQLSSIHFASTPQYAERIISMGIPSELVFHAGAPGAEIIDDNLTDNVEISDPDIDKDFFDKTGLTPEDSFVIFAMHPVTNLPDKGLGELKETLVALESIINQGIKILITMPNSDPGTLEFTRKINEWAQSFHEDVKTVKSLGHRLFPYALEQADAIIGNSSAALIEAPSYRLPAVNVGIRQKGRVHGPTVIDVPGNRSHIEEAIKTALSLEMKAVASGLGISALNPYYKKDSAGFIADTLLEFLNK